MVDVISSILDTLIAIIALVIAIFEMKNNRRARKAEIRIQEDRKNKKRIIEDLVNHTSEITKPIEEFQTFYDAVGKLKGDELLQFFVDKTNDILQSENDFFDTIEKLYISMLRNESEFSLSYGFDRYINCFRDFINKRQRIEDAKISYFELIEYIKNHRESFVQSELVGLVNNLLLKLGEINSLNGELLPFCKELNLKYGNDNYGV